MASSIASSPRRSNPRRRAAVAWVALLGLATATHALREQLGVAAEQARRVAPALGVHVVDVESGETVYAYQPDRRRILASNTKLVTSAAALDRLSPAHFITTQLLATGTVGGGRLDGDLAVVGSGDPTFSGRHYGDDPLHIFRAWGERLVEQGISRVAGDLLLADGLFSGPSVHPDWPRDQLHKWYEAPSSALSFNDNCVWVWVRPGRRAGDAALVEITPAVPTVELRSTVRTTSRSRNHRIVVDRAPDSDVIEVSGWIYRHSEPFVVAVTVPDPELFFAHALRKGLAEAGVAIEGTVRIGRRLPAASWRELASHRTDLMTVLEVINKRSQNFYAENLLKLLGAIECGEGSWEAGRRVIEDFLTGVGITAGGYRYADGSGMSRDNLFTPRQITTLLRHMYFHPHGREYMRTLAYSGESDTDPPWMESSLSERLDAPGYRHNVLAKTGGLNGVSTLSGYVKSHSGRLYAFSILCNSTRGNWRAKQAQDRIVRTLIDRG